MGFAARSSTFRRPDVLARRLEGALVDPHSAQERFDDTFMLGMQCQACGKVGSAERRHIRAAISDHAQRCPRRGQVASVVVRVLYPKQ